MTKILGDEIAKIIHDNRGAVECLSNHQQQSTENSSLIIVSREALDAVLDAIEVIDTLCNNIIHDEKD